jgi:hypothetical protein
MVLKEYKCIDGYNEIVNKLGSNYTNLDEDYKVYLGELKNAADGFIVCKDELSVSDLEEGELKQIIGKNGCYFIMTTHNYNLDFLWYNGESKCIEFWGPQKNINGGMAEIQRRINRFRNKIID